MLNINGSGPCSTSTNLDLLKIPPEEITRCGLTSINLFLQTEDSAVQEGQEVWRGKLLPFS